VSTISIEEAIERIRNGKMIILSDDEDRENEGDFVIAAQFATPEAINFMAKYGRGLICITLTQEKAESLHLDPMTSVNEASFGTDFTISVDAREGISTGISAFDRAHTIQLMVRPEASPRSRSAPATSFRSGPSPGACSSGQVRRRGPSTWRVWPA
jgi:GTP cyclohydrolase II (EC 3.5.4.25)/3,4-dihydroxy-2-butanone 4-phosphate synthase (EC 4.1.2.-)